MASYAYTLVLASLFSAVIMLLTPKSCEKITKLVAFIGALIMIAVMIAPVPALFEKELSFSDDEVIEYEDADKSKSTAEYYATSVGDTLCAIYGEKQKNVKAQVLCSDEGRIVKLTLIVNGDVSYDKEEASKALKDIYGIDIEVREGDK